MESLLTSVAYKPFLNIVFKHQINILVSSNSHVYHGYSRVPRHSVSRTVYRFYNQYDSYPEGLGKQIVGEIPNDPEAYQQWLAERRQEALEGHIALQRFLCRKRADYEDVKRLTRMSLTQTIVRAQRRMSILRASLPKHCRTSRLRSMTSTLSVCTPSTLTRKSSLSTTVPTSS